jgi:hypothetical protein
MLFEAESFCFSSNRLLRSEATVPKNQTNRAVDYAAKQAAEPTLAGIWVNGVDHFLRLNARSDAGHTGDASRAKARPSRRNRCRRPPLGYASFDLGAVGGLMFNSRSHLTSPIAFSAIDKCVKFAYQMCWCLGK